MRRVLVLLTLLSIALAACNRGAAPAPPAPAPAAASAPAPAAPAAASVSASAPAAPADTAVSAKPALTTAPPVTLKVGYLAVTAWAPLYLAREKGYFQEVGLDVDAAPFGNYASQMPLLAQGQLHVAGCADAVVCYNAFGRGLDIRIVADLQSAGATEKSKNANALVVRKDLWDNGTIRGARDLVGRTLYTQAGPGSGQHANAAHWLLRNGVDPGAMEWNQLQFPDLYASMQNGAAEVGFHSEPFITAGINRGVHQILAGLEEMDPNVQSTFVMYWTGIDQLGPQVGERFMVAFLRAGRDFLNAMEYGTDQDMVIDVLSRDTGIKDPAVHRQSKYPWHWPNGEVSREALQADADLFADLGLMEHMDISRTFDDRYREFAVSYLGEYQPPR